MRSFLLLLLLPAVARADTLVPPWNDPDDLPIPAWAKSVAPRNADVVVYAAPGKLDARRGTLMRDVRLPLFGAKRSAGCNGRWLEVGPLAWVCSEAAEMSPDDRFAPPLPRHDDGLPFHYYFAGPDGAYGYLNLETALDDAPDLELEPGFGVAIDEEKVAHGERWGRTRQGRWLALRELGAARPSTFHGEELDGTLDVAWVTSDRASVFATAKPDKPTATRSRFQVVHVREESATPSGMMVRISAGGEAPAQWMRAKDLARPMSAAPPDEIGGAAALEKWIDVELATQTLVAYEGQRPVFATLVSTGSGAPGSETATPPGTHRIWVKLFTTDMGNLGDEEADKHYSIEDVPWVMFFDRGVALHAAFWHRDFGRSRSHGCVNLAPLDARRLFEWTAPHVPRGWTAAFPSRIEKGTAVRVR